MGSKEDSARWLAKPGNRDKANARNRARNAAWCDRIAAIKLESGCVDCGYNEYPEALDWDHRPDEVKVFSVGTARLAWHRIEAEMAKCDIVCANCHRHRTAVRGYKNQVVA